MPVAAGASGGDASDHVFRSGPGNAMASPIPPVGMARPLSDRTAWTTAAPDLGTHNPLTDGGAWRAGSSSWRGVPRGDARLAGPVARRNTPSSPTAPVAPVVPVAPVTPVTATAPVAPPAPAAPQGLWLEGCDPGGNGPA